MNRTLQSIALFLFFSISMMAQSIPCFDFEDFPAGTQIGPASGNSPGDVLFSEAGIQVSILEIQYPDGSTGFENAMILDGSTGWLDGQFFFMGNNSLSFDLSQADGSLNQLCFDFSDGGGVENFAVNGSPVAILQSFSEIEGLNFPGVTVEVTFTNAGSLEQGTVCITGDIERLLVGGQEFGIDNVCVDAVLACPIANLQAEIVSCDADGNYNILVDFDWLSPLTVISTFDIFIDGEFAAFISETDLPYLLEGIQPATDALEFTLTVCQNDNLACCASIILQKQCPAGSCMEFEELSEPVYGSSAGTPPGTEFYNESDIGLLLIPFQSLFWTNTYGDLIVLNETDNPEMTAASGQYLKFESINAVFDLTGYPDPIDSVVVDYYYNGGAINLAANGSNILIQNALAPGLYALAPGITLRVVSSTADARAGQLIFAGNVQSLLIGGDGDFRIDNLCVNPPPPVPCRLGNMAIELGPCNDDGSFLATINLEYQGTSDSFSLLAPAVQGNFAYADLPITVGPLPSNNSGVYTFLATDLAQDGCRAENTIQAVPCTGCAFEGLSIDYLGLSDNGQNIIRLDFELVNPTLTDFFSVYFDGVLYERFNWSDVPLEIRVPCDATTDLIQEITVCEGEDFCCVTLPLIFLEPCLGACSITNVEVQPGPCNPNNVFEVKFDFDHQNTSDTFELWLNGNATGRFYAYVDLPVVIGPFVAPTDELEFTAVDVERADCSGTAVLPAYNCSNPCTPIISVDYERTPCLDDGTFGILITEVILDTDDPMVSNTIFVRVNGQPYGSFNLNGLPFAIEPLPGDGVTEHRVVLTTANTAACGYPFTVGPVDCGFPCNNLIDSVSYYLTDCNDAGNYAIVIDQLFPNPPNLAFLFNVSVDGVLVGSFSSASLPIDLGSFPGNGEPHWVAVYTAQSTDACAYVFDTEPVFCDDDCPLESVQLVGDVQCDDTGFYRAQLRIDGAAVGDALTITSTLTNFSNTIVYTGNLVVVEMPNTGLNFDELQVCLPFSSTNEQCCIGIAFDIPCQPCGIFDVQLQPLDCNADGYYFFTVDFEVSGPVGGTFFLMAGNDYNATFQASDLPVTLGPLPGNGQVVSVWINDENQFCQVDLEMQAPDCGLVDCFIEPILEAVCSPDGGYDLFVDLQHGGTGSHFVITSAASGWSETLAYADLPLILHIPANVLQDDIRICDTERPDCCASAWVTVDCPCPGFGNVTITPNDCRDDGTFTATLDITIPGPAIDIIFVVESEGYVEEFFFADLPVEIGPFPGTGEPRTVHVFIPGLNCEETVTFITPDCDNGGCMITSVIAEPHGCDGGQFLVDVEVQAVNPGGSGYFIFADGQINGPFSYNQPFVTLGPFDGDGMEEYGFLVLDIEDLTCSGYTEVGPIDCGMACGIFDLLVQPLGCNDDGTYNVFLNFEVENPGNDFFEVYGRNGNLIDFYRLEELPIVIEGLPRTFFGEGYLRVCINDNPNCCEEIFFAEPDCNDDCRIYDVQADFAYCDDDGNFFVRLSFNFENTASGGFRVFGNGQDYGTFSYTMPFPVLVGPIAPTGALAYELIVADLGDPDCRGFTGFGAFDCDDDPQACITFDEFETQANDTVILAMTNPEDSIYDEDDVVMNAVAVPFGSNADYFESVVGFSAPECGFNTDGGNLWLDGGVEMDFSHFTPLPHAITFDVSFCNSPNTIPQIVIGANGEQYSGPVTNLPDGLPGGITLEFVPLVNTAVQGQLRLEGPIGQLLIGGQRLFVDNICFDRPQPPVVDDCVSFDVYDGFPTDTLADFGQAQDLQYEEDGVIVTASPIEWNGAANFFTGVYDFDDNNCGFGDDDAALYFGGALRFSFAGRANLPERTSFDLAFCPAQSRRILLRVNGEEYRGEITSLPAMLSNVDILASTTTVNGQIWRVELNGTVEDFVIGGSRLAIDDVCFNVDPLVEEVWPGDANADNIAHHIDLLNIGLAYGFQGSPRFEDGANWTGVSAANWPQEFADGLNYKHADCNGDGVVDDTDRQVLAQNYGRTHGPLAAVPELPGTDIDPPAYIDFPGQMPVGSSFNIPIVVGTQDLPIQDVYGIAFTVEYDPQVFDASALDISYPVSWFGEPGINALSIDRTFAAEGRIEIAVTRTDQNNVSGYGPVAYLIGIIDDIAGLKTDTEVSIQNIVALSVDEERIPLQGQSVLIELRGKEEEPPAGAKGVFSVFPNPTRDWVTVTSKYGYQPEQLTLLTLDGRELRAPQEENRRVSLQGLPAGTYILSIRTGDTRVHKLIVKD